MRKRDAAITYGNRNREVYALLCLNESLIYMVASLKQMKFTMQK
ncbi:hypothetical protein HMPREF0083_04474 [Aneurinibacillus aneurinilyticus ATCC 12856]|uniref:Uncharacterized protein n=1 Tax=Aneurinibacillus aneurinilyticus ATCC 12856 TaxID=649747 RepID=U1WFW4_ANEAE|nr:hypothetical protein HMPREF0083_04474 [Aneurinibacillus aneurinilyticus ATCC 12856]